MNTRNGLRSDAAADTNTHTHPHGAAADTNTLLCDDTLVPVVVHGLGEGGGGEGGGGVKGAAGEVTERGIESNAVLGGAGGGDLNGGTPEVIEKGPDVGDAGLETHTGCV